MYQIKFHDPKTIAKRFLKLSASNDWKRGDLSVEHQTDYLLIRGERPLKKSEEKDEKRKVSVQLYDDLVEVYEETIISHHLSSTYEVLGKQDRYVLDSTYALIKYQTQFRILLNHCPKEMVQDWRLKSFTTESISQEKTVFQDTNRMPIVPLIKVKKKVHPLQRIAESIFEK